LGVVRRELPQFGLHPIGLIRMKPLCFPAATLRKSVTSPVASVPFGITTSPSAITLCSTLSRTNWPLVAVADETDSNVTSEISVLLGMVTNSDNAWGAVAAGAGAEGCGAWDAEAGTITCCATSCEQRRKQRTA
jgi:hypothetical protein